MELVTGPPQLHATDIVVVANGPGQPLSATAFNLLASNSKLPPTLAWRIGKPAARAARRALAERVSLCAPIVAPVDF